MDLVFKNVTLHQPIERPDRTGKYSFKSLLSFDKSCKSFPASSDRESVEANSPQSVSSCRKILDNVSGFAKCGQILGVLGPSGSGKTTLLNILSGRLQPNQGCVTLNGDALNKQIRRKICYVLQHDIFFPDLTLKQTLMYTAMLRLPESMNTQQKMNHVQNVIDLLDLGSCQDTIIGDFLRRGLSGGEKKRANIACELLSNPSVMLLDEPTSGLDSATALKIMKFLKDYAMKERKTVVVTIHQPSSQIFYLFNELLLLSTGKLAYFGDVDKVIPFFEKIGFTIAPNYNPADFMIEKIRGPEEDLLKIIKAAEKLDKSPNLSFSRRSTGSGCSISFFNRKASRKQAARRNQLENQKNQHNRDCITKESGSQYDGDHELESGKEDLSETESTFKNHLWTSHTDVAKEIHDHQHHHSHPGSGIRHHGDGLRSVELRVVIDPCNKKMQKIYTKILSNHEDVHDDSGRSSWTETDRCSTSTFSSTCLSSRCSSTSKISDSDCKWPTTFWTQFKVLTHRNYNESRSRLLSKLNWIQIISLALITGILWFQVPRTDNSINDVRGWMFFASSYWMLFALFSSLASIPLEKEVINKERASGAYRLSAYYLAKLVGELPATVTLPTVYHVISYPMFSCYSLATFLLQWAFLILNSIVAQTIGFVIGVTSNDLQLSITISALYSMTTNLFGGFYSTAIPWWLSWVKYLSIVHYAFHNMQIIEFTYGPPISCSSSESPFSFCSQQNASKSVLSIPSNVILKHLEAYSEPFPIWLNTLILVLFLVSFQIFGYLILKWFRKPK